MKTSPVNQEEARDLYNEVMAATGPSGRIGLSLEELKNYYWDLADAQGRAGLNGYEQVACNQRLESLRRQIDKIGTMLRSILFVWDFIGILPRVSSRQVIGLSRFLRFP
jgi:hypothetical protein